MTPPKKKAGSVGARAPQQMAMTAPDGSSTEKGKESESTAQAPSKAPARVALTIKQMELFCELAAAGIPLERIATHLDLPNKKLEEKIARDYRLKSVYQKAVDTANAQVAKSLHTRAVSGDVPACTFWLKARAKWRDRDEEQTTKPVVIRVESAEHMQRIDDDDSQIRIEEDED